jgi:imidazolonepropionase-like amidohydrolase
VKVAELFGKYDIRPVIVGGEEADRVAARLEGKVAGVVLGPEVVTWRGGERVNRASGLAEAGVPFLLGSFASGGAEGLGLAAAFAVRHGLDRRDALRSLTGGAGEVLGLGEGPRPGTLLRGSPADLVVYSGDPFEATSRVLLVIAGGEVIHPSEGEGGREVGR